jgi:hypothetical protein
MKNFFYFSSFMYTLAIVLIIVATMAWPAATPAPVGPPLQSALYLVVFIISIVGFTGFCFGLWEKFQEKGK